MQNDNNKKPGLSWSTPSQPQSAQPAAQKPATSPMTNLPAAPATPAAGGISKYAGMFVAGVIIGVLLMWGYTATTHTPTVATDNGSNTSATMTATSTMDMPASAPVLEVASPQAAGWSVAITKATVSTPTWVVVYDDNAGKPGSVLGAQLFATSGAGVVTLLRGTVAGETYFVGESPDNGDHKFAMATDKPTLSADGSVTLATFVAQ